MIKLLAVDLDGTCLDDNNNFPLPTLNALKKAQKSGVEVVICTGRAFDCLPTAIKKESFYRYAICSNGALIFDREKGERIYNNSVNYLEFIPILKECQSLNLGITLTVGCQHIIEGEKLYLMAKSFFKSDVDKSILTADAVSYLLSRKENVEEIQIFYSSKNLSQINSMIEKYKTLSSSLSSLYVEFYALNGGKGSGLKVLAKALNIEREEIAVCGDSPNDIPMFKEAGLKFCVANASDSLNELSTHQVESSNEFGVKTAVDIILNLNENFS